MADFSPKEYLSGIKYIDEDIKSRQEEVCRLRQAVTIKTSSIKLEVVQETRRGAFDERYIEMIGKAEDINRKIDELVDTKVRVSNEIDLMDDRVSRIILREKYVNLKTYEEIAEIMGYDLRHLYKLHGRALESFKSAMLRHVMTLK